MLEDGMARPHPLKRYVCRFVLLKLRPAIAEAVHFLPRPGSCLRVIEQLAVSPPTREDVFCKVVSRLPSPTLMHWVFWGRCK
jgi:hypothetical protein